MDGFKMLLKSTQSLLYFSSLDVVVHPPPPHPPPPPPPPLTINTSQTVYFFNQLNHIIFLENMTNKITSIASRMETTKFSLDNKMYVQIFQLLCSLENKIYVREYRKIIRV